MISLHRFTRLQADAKYQRQVALTAKRVGRAGQIARSSVETGDGTASVGDLLADAPTVAETVEDHVADLETLDPGLDVFDDTQETEDAAHQADMAAIGANLVVTEAMDAAEDAAELALEAKVTADGRNRIYAQAINPVAAPDFPFVNGDLWYRTEVVGGETRFVEVFMWNGTEWKPYQMVASSLLVPGTVGPTLIENGAITTGKLAATAIDGMTVTGALLRTAAAGARFELTNIGLVGYNSFGAVTARMTPGAGGISVASPAGDLLTSMDGSNIRVAKAASVNEAETYVSRSGVLARSQTEFSGLGANNGEGRVEPAIISAQRILNPGGTFPSYGADTASVSSRDEEGFVGISHRAPGSVNSVGIDMRVGGAAGSYFALIEAFESTELEVRSNGGIYFNAPSVRFSGDTDWVVIPTPSGWTEQRAVRVRSVNGTIHWQGRITPTSPKSGTVTVFPAGTVPEWARPESIYDAMRIVTSTESATDVAARMKSAAVNSTGSVAAWYGGTANSDPINLAGLSGYFVG